MEQQQLEQEQLKQQETIKRIIDTPDSNISFYSNDKGRPKGCLYIFSEKCYRDLNQNIYKIGFTVRNARDRLRGYSRDTNIIYEHYLNLDQNELRQIESEIKREFKIKFKPCQGSSERFEGNLEEIKNEFIRIIERETQGKNINFQEEFRNEFQDEVYELMKNIPQLDTRNMDYQTAKLENIGNLTKYFLSQFNEEECSKFLDEMEQNRIKYKEKEIT